MFPRNGKAEFRRCRERTSVVLRVSQRLAESCAIGIEGRLPVLPSHTTVHAGPHTAVRRVELVVNSRAFDTARRQTTIRSLHRRPSELHSSCRPEGPTRWLFCRWSLLSSRDVLATPFRSGLPPLFWSNTPFADFCDMVKVNRFTFSHEPVT